MKNPWDTGEKSSDARAVATRRFCDELNGMSYQERSVYTLPKPNQQAEIEASNQAKRRFADLGDFVIEGDENPDEVPEIPASLMFRVYEEGFPPESPTGPYSADRDHVVYMVLPEPDSEIGDDPSEYYRCSYWPYLPDDERDPFMRARKRQVARGMRRST